MARLLELTSKYKNIHDKMLSNSLKNSMNTTKAMVTPSLPPPSRWLAPPASLFVQVARRVSSSSISRSLQARAASRAGLLPNTDK